MSESVKLQSQTNSLMRAMDAFNEAIMLVDMEEGRWTVMFTNDAWLRFMSAPPNLLPPGSALYLGLNTGTVHMVAPGLVCLAVHPCWS